MSLAGALPPIVQEFRGNYKDVVDAHKKIKASTKDMVDDTDRETSRMSGLFGGVAKAAAGVAIGLAAAAVGVVAGIIHTGVQEAKDASAINAQLTAGIESTGNAAGVTLEGMNKLATSIQAFSGQTDDSIAGAQALLLGFTNISNSSPDKTFDRATLAAANMAARLGGDAASQATVLGKALNDPINGLAALTRKGIQFTDAQKAQIAAMVEAGDVAGAQGIILDELDKKFGGAAEAAGQSLPGSLARARRAFEDLSQSVVEKFLPIVTPAISGMVDWLQKAAPVAEAVAGRVANGLSNIVASVKGVFGFLKSGEISESFAQAFNISESSPIIGVLQNIRDTAGPIFDSIKGAFATLAPVIAPLIGQFVQLQSAISPMALIFKAIGPLIPQIVSTLATLAATVGGALGQALGQILPVIGEVVTLLSGELGTVMEELLPVVVDLAGVLGGVLGEVIKQLAPVIVMVVQFVGQLLKAVLPLIQPILSLAMAFLPLLEPLLQLIGPILTPLIQMLTQILTPVMGLVTALLSYLVPAITTVVEGLTSSLIPIIDAVVQILGGLIDFLTGVFTGDWEKAWNGIVSIFSGIWNGIKGIVLGVLNTVIDVINGMINGINGLAGGISDLTGGAINLRLGTLPRLSFDVGTDRVPGGRGQAVAAIIHGGEAVLSNAMLDGSAPIPERVTKAVELQQGAAAVAQAGNDRGPTHVEVNVKTDASPTRIASEVGWVLRRRG